MQTPIKIKQIGCTFTTSFSTFPVKSIGIYEFDVVYGFPWLVDLYTPFSSTKLYL